MLKMRGGKNYHTKYTITDFLNYSGASLIRIALIRIIHLSGHKFENQSPFLNRMCLTYPEIQLSGQSVWEQRFPDKWGSTVSIMPNGFYVTQSFVTCVSYTLRILWKRKENPTSYIRCQRLRLSTDFMGKWFCRFRGN